MTEGSSCIFGSPPASVSEDEGWCRSHHARAEACSVNWARVQRGPVFLLIHGFQGQGDSVASIHLSEDGALKAAADLIKEQTERYAVAEFRGAPLSWKKTDQQLHTNTLHFWYGTFGECVEITKEVVQP